jgi:hypothetical protein
LFQAGLFSSFVPFPAASTTSFTIIIKAAAIYDPFLT